MRKYCRVAGRGLRPVMADHRNKIRRATQQEKKVRASTIFEIQLLSLFIERVWLNKTVTVNKIRLRIQDLNAKRNHDEQKGGVT